MCRRKCSLVLAALLIASIAYAQSKNDSNSFTFRGFSGGMMIHAGYLSSGKFIISDLDGNSLGEQQIKGMEMGLGGVARFHFGTTNDQIRIGGEGYTSSVNYSPEKSYEKIGWGGLLIDYVHHGKGRVSPFIGATVGGGGVRNHTFPSASIDDYVVEKYASYRKNTFFCIVPFVGMEIALTSKVLLTLKADYQIHLPHIQKDFAEGVRLYVGIVFNRVYK